MRAVNLLPTAARSQEHASSPTASEDRVPGGRTGAYVVLGGLAAVALGVGALTLAGNTVTERQRELASVEAQQQVAQAEAARLAPFGVFKQLAQTRTQTVHQLASSRFDWAAALKGLSRAVPRTVTITAATGTVNSTVSAPGGASNPLRTAIEAPAVELTGCAKNQTTVADFMGRLRAIPGVTRVSLASSVRGQQSDDDQAAAGSTKPSGCGLGSPPEFSIVAFFERATATAAGSGGAGVASGAAGASATPAATPAAGSAGTTTTKSSDGSAPPPTDSAASPSTSSTGSSAPSTDSTSTSSGSSESQGGGN